MWVAALCAACGGESGEGARKAPPADSSVVTRAARATPGVPEESAAATGGPLTVLFVGTSLTAGLGLDPEEAYPALVERLADSAGLRLRVVNAGLSGETSAGTLRRIDWLLRGPVDVFVLETGANDGLRALNVDSTRRNIQAILEKVRTARPGARVMLMQMEAPPNLGRRYTADFRAMFPAVARAHGVALGPFLLEGVAGMDSLNQADGIHPNAEGARRVAATVWTALRPEVQRAAAGATLDPRP